MFDQLLCTFDDEDIDHRDDADDGDDNCHHDADDDAVDDYKDDGDKVDDEHDVVCDDDNDGCRFGQMQLVQEVVQQITGHAPVTYQLYFSRLHARAFSIRGPQCHSQCT